MKKPKAKRKLYSNEFKAEAVQMVLKGERPSAEVARNLGVSYGALLGWVRDAKGRGGNYCSATPEEREENERLRKENRILRQERDILKKGLAFFAKENS